MSYMIAQTYQLDVEILHKISNLLMQHQVNQNYFPDGWKMMESAMRFKTLQKINMEDVDDFQKSELALTVNSLIEERKEILSVFDKINSDRQLLREKNMELTRRLFYMEKETKDPCFDLFLNKMLFLNYDFLKNALQRERDKAERLLKEIDGSKKELLDSKKHTEQLHYKLEKSRDQLKQFLATGGLDNHFLDAESFNKRNNLKIYQSNNILNTSNDMHDLSGDNLMGDNSGILKEESNDLLDNGFQTKRLSGPKPSPMNKNSGHGLSSIQSAADLHSNQGKGKVSGMMNFSSKGQVAPGSVKGKASPIISKASNGTLKPAGNNNTPLNSSFRSNYEAGAVKGAMMSSRGDLNKSGLLKTKPEDLKPTIGMKKSENGKKPSTMSISSMSQINTNTKGKK